MSTYAYNPVPTRVWSRVQGTCTYADVQNNSVPPAEDIYQLKILYKGNILQYKNNSAMFTKKQQYSRIARGYSCTRNHSFSTQTQTYTNPNNLGLLRLYYKTYVYPNELVGAPNNVAGPFEPDVPNPNDCPSNSVRDGGILVAGNYADPCTNQTIREIPQNPIVCSSMSSSDVPGIGYLCWDKRLQTYFPRYKYTNNNSGTKWPQGYRALVSAVNPQQVTDCLTQTNNTSV